MRSRVQLLNKSEQGTLERHTAWEPAGGSGVYRRGLLVWRNFHRKYEPCDVLVFLDGQNLFLETAAGAPQAWAAASRFSRRDEALLVVAVPATRKRYQEYVGWSHAPGHYSASGQAHAHFLTHELLDYIRLLHPRSRLKGLAGASAGGVAALYAAWMNPGKFPAVACLSAGRHYFDELLESFPGVPAPRTYLSCASRGMDAGFRAQNQRFAKTLRRRGGDVLLRLHRGDHSERTWGRRLPDLLRFFL